MTVPLPNPLSVSETLLLLGVAFFFARWGWRHGIDAVVLAGLFILLADVFSDDIARIAANIINFVYAFIQLLNMGQMSMPNVMAVVNGTSDILPPIVDPNQPGNTGYVVLTILVFVVISYVAFHYSDKKVGGKDPFFESLFGFVGGGVLGYISITFVLGLLLQPAETQTVVINTSDVPQIKIDAGLLVAIVLVLIVFGYSRSRPKKK